MPPPYGGGEIVSHLLYSGLRNDYDFFLIKRAGHSKAKQQNISLSSYLFGIKYLIEVVCHIRRLKPDKIYIGLPKTFGAFLRNSLIIYYCQFKGISVLAELHGMSFPFLTNPIYSHFFKKTINIISKIRVLSTSVREYLFLQGYSNKVSVVDNAIELPLNINFPVSVRSGFFNLLYLGLISENKGFSRLLEVVRKLKEKCINNIKINVMGEWYSDDYKASCLEKIRQYVIGDSFVFHGALYHEEKWIRMSENDLIIHLTKFDGQPLSIIECMALGIPAISTYIGGIPEMITDKSDGFLITHDEEIVDIIEKLVNHNLDLSSLRINCLNTYDRRFTPEVFYRNMRDFIES